jgi:polyisoprenyl-phosphate glycosyltransferase
MVSVVVPIFNEEENLPELRRRLVATLDKTGAEWEIIFVDDGGRDHSAEIIRKFHEEDSRLKLVSLSRNFGHQPAITAGIHHARGDCVALIDGDLQDPPELIEQMVQKWKEGFQVVIGERTSRAERGLRGIGFRIFYPLMGLISDFPMHSEVGIFGLMDRAVVDQFNRLPERNRFIPGLRTWLGFRQTSVYYDRQERAAGAPKQNLRRLIRYGLDGMISFSYKPLRAATYMGFCVSGITLLLAIYYLATFFLFHKRAGSGFTTVILCVLFLGSVQLICVGILGEYIGRIYEEIKQRPLYIVQQKIGFSDLPAEHARPLTESSST